MSDEESDVVAHRVLTVQVDTNGETFCAVVYNDGPTMIFEGYDTLTEIYDQLADLFDDATHQ